MISYYPVIRTKYALSNNVQKVLSRRLLDFKLSHTDNNAASSYDKMAFLGYEMDPVYTFGRRQKTVGLNDLKPNTGTAFQALPEFPEFPESQTLKELKAFKPGQSGISNASEKNEVDIIGNISDNNFDVVHTERGGHTTFHGPGQVVLYPILDLQVLKLKIREYICILETSAVSVLSKYGIDAELRKEPGFNGVWIKNTMQKIASVGVHCRYNVTSHGIALNVDTDKKWFKKIVACNLPNADMVSMREIAGPNTKLDVSTVGLDLANEIAKKMSVRLQIKSLQDSKQLISECDLH